MRMPIEASSMTLSAGMWQDSPVGISNRRRTNQGGTSNSALMTLAAVIAVNASNDLAARR